MWRRVGVLICMVSTLASSCGSAEVDDSKSGQRDPERDAGPADAEPGSESSEAGSSSTDFNALEDALANVPCEPWQPSDADWSSLPLSRPSLIGELSTSVSGQYLYTIGTWLDAGMTTRAILRSPDLGETWCVLSSPQGVSTVAPSRASDSVLYALSCDPVGVVTQLNRSNDGGATWTAASTALPELAGCALQTSVADPDTISIGNVLSGVIYTTPAEDLAAISRDGGESWTGVSAPAGLVPPGDYDPTHPIHGIIVGRLIDPISFDRWLVWGVLGASGDTQPLRWFASPDAGRSWRELEAPVPSTGEPPRDVLVDAGGSLYVASGSDLLRSDDWGETWTMVGALPDPTVRIRTLDTLAVGRLFAWHADGTSPMTAEQATVWRSLDRGATWSTVSVPIDPAVDPVLAPKRADGRDVIVGVGTAWLTSTTNGGMTWQQHPIVPAPGEIVQSAVDGQRLWAQGMLANARVSARSTGYPGLQSTDGGFTWTLTSADAGPLLMDGASADVAYSGLRYGSGVPQRTDDGGQTWTPLSIPAVGVIMTAESCRAPHSCLYVLLENYSAPDPSCSLVRSDDRGVTWSEPIMRPPNLCLGALASSPDDPRHLAAACGTTSVCVSQDGGESWASHSVATDPDRGVASVLFVDGGILASTVTVGTAGAHRSLVARSEDDGSSWTAVSSEGGRLVASAARPHTVFLISLRSNAATAVHRSDDSGATWRLLYPLTSADRDFDVMSIVDAPDGSYIATTTAGLVRFE